MNYVDWTLEAHEVVALPLDDLALRVLQYSGSISS